MKDTSAELRAHYASGSTSLAKLWRIVRKDGLAFCFTDHDVSIEYLGNIYAPSSVFDSSAIGTRAELNVANLTAQGLFDSDGITKADIEAGLWDGATFRMLEVNFRDLTMGHNVLRVGKFGEVKRKEGYFYVELRGLMDDLQNNIGRIIVPTCDANLGDARCGFDLESRRVSGEVASVVTERREFESVDLIDSPDDPGYYDYGEVTWVTGLNAGLSMEVKLHEAGGIIMLQLQMPYAFDVGDQFTIVPGCDKVHRVVDGVVTGDCKNKFNNVLDFRGFDDVPGADQVLLVGGQ